MPRYCVIVEATLNVDADDEEKAMSIANARCWDFLPDVDSVAINLDDMWEIDAKQELEVKWNGGSETHLEQESEIGDPYNPSGFRDEEGGGV